MVAHSNQRRLGSGVPCQAAGQQGMPLRSGSSAGRYRLRPGPFKPLRQRHPWPPPSPCKRWVATGDQRLPARVGRCCQLSTTSPLSPPHTHTRTNRHQHIMLPAAPEIREASSGRQSMPPSEKGLAPLSVNQARGGRTSRPSASSCSPWSEGSARSCRSTMPGRVGRGAGGR